MTTIEAVLFAAAKPVKISTLCDHLHLSKKEVREAIDDIIVRFNTDASGIHLLEQEGAIQFVSNALSGAHVAKFLKAEAQGPLTRPSLETLTIIAYRGPITKPEIERVRGVNCSLILRNLLIRGYINEEEDRARLQPVYALSHDFLRAIGVKSVKDLPNYETFKTDDGLNSLLSRESEVEV